MKSSVLPNELKGHFFGVGSWSTSDPHDVIDLVKDLQLPYWFQLPKRREEDMIRQFGSLIEIFEDDGDLTLDVDMYLYQDITSSSEPMVIHRENALGLYLMKERGLFKFFKTQQTAPATMCFSIHAPDGGQLISDTMLEFFTSLMKRAARGQVELLSDAAENLILCQDDPALGFVISRLRDKTTKKMTIENVIRKTESVYPSGVIPAYHYCDDWRVLVYNGKYLLWENRPKLVHIDVIRYEPKIDEVQAEAINVFMDSGGGFALGVLPNTDDAYSSDIMTTLKKELGRVLTSFKKSGVDIDLLVENTMISTQCGLSGASFHLAKDIHITSRKFPQALKEVHSSF